MFKCWPSILSPANPQSPMNFLINACVCSHRRRVRGAEVEAVPPGNVLDGAVLVEQQHVGMIVQEVGSRRDRQRRVPEPRLQAGGANVRDQTAHVGLAVRILGAIGIPIADHRLPAVVDDGPLQAQLLHLGQRSLDQRRGAGAFVAPGAPDRLVGRRRRDRRRQAAFGHEAPIGTERGEIVAVVDRHEGLGRFEHLAGPEVTLLAAADGHADGAALPLHGKRDALRRGLRVAHREPAVASPDIDDGRAAAVVGTPPCRESCPARIRVRPVAPSRGDPRTSLRNSTRTRERARRTASTRRVAIGPAAKAQDPGAGVAIGDAHQRDAGMTLIQRRLHGLLDAVDRGSRQRDPRARTVGIVDAAPRLMMDREVGDMPGVATPAVRVQQILARTPSGHRNPPWSCRTRYPRVKLRIPFDAQNRILEGGYRASLRARLRRFPPAPAAAHGVAQARARRPAEQTVDAKSCRESVGLCSWTVAQRLLTCSKIIITLNARIRKLMPG